MSVQGDHLPTAAPRSELRVQLRLRTADEPAARELAARLIDRAHELANTPECECDLDVDVEWDPVGTQP
ncbi:MAG TPA: hypothetical protein VHU13_08405 [Solirubrobacteraceae bacterium]|jgi:hypothetical protein|nr:hypothetical protein [Solirubrobacteraceae bacterium]